MTSFGRHPSSMSVFTVITLRICVGYLQMTEVGGDFLCGLEESFVII